MKILYYYKFNSDSRYQQLLTRL